MIKRDCLVSVPHTKGGAIVWTFVKDHIIYEKEYYKYIVIRGVYYKLFDEDEGGGNREGLDGYPYLKHLIQFWPGDWVKRMEKINEAVGMKIFCGGWGSETVGSSFQNARVLEMYLLRCIGSYI